MGNFSFGGGRPHHRRRYSQPRGPRKNERIRVPEVRVIGPDGKQIGVIPTRKAQAMARDAGLDLVEVSPSAQPPVCRILDYGKYMYEESKKKPKSASTSSKLKEVKFRVRTDTHDYQVKLRHAEEFLDKGNKVKLSLMFRGRENEHKELGVQTINRAIGDLDHIGVSDGDPRLMGRFVNATVSPLPVNKRKLKWTLREDGTRMEDSAEDHVEEDDEDELHDTHEDAAQEEVQAQAPERKQPSKKSSKTKDDEFDPLRV